MAAMLARTLLIGIWALMPLLLISHSALEVKKFRPPSALGNYEFQSKGDFNQTLQGKVKFELEQHFIDENDQYLTLRLQLQDSSASTHSMEFLMCFKEAKEKMIGKTFKVAKRIDGFSDYFEGVYGVVNGGNFGELPFFAEEGKITILEVGDAVLQGEINMKVSNFEGKFIEVDGDFIATR